MHNVNVSSTLFAHIHKQANSKKNIACVQLTFSVQIVDTGEQAIWTFPVVLRLLKVLFSWHGYALFNLVYTMVPLLVLVNIDYILAVNSSIYLRGMGILKGGNSVILSHFFKGVYSIKREKFPSFWEHILSFYCKFPLKETWCVGKQTTESHKSYLLCEQQPNLSSPP